LLSLRSTLFPYTTLFRSDSRIGIPRSSPAWDFSVSLQATWSGALMILSPLASALTQRGLAPPCLLTHEEADSVTSSALAVARSIYDKLSTRCDQARNRQSFVGRGCRRVWVLSQPSSGEPSR